MPDLRLRCEPEPSDTRRATIPGFTTAKEPRMDYLFVCFLAALCLDNVYAAIDCFKCVSINGNNPACDDPFHNNYTSEIYESPCMGGRKDRNGLFPATACIKMAGEYQNGTKITVRGCALDSGSLTTDTEIIRMSHCGAFYLDGNYIRGCLQSCHDADACNRGVVGSRTSSVIACGFLAYLTLR